MLNKISLALGLVLSVSSVSTMVQAHGWAEYPYARQKYFVTTMVASGQTQFQMQLVKQRLMRQVQPNSFNVTKSHHWFQITLTLMRLKLTSKMVNSVLLAWLVKTV